jgi:hypothetical protein
MRELNAPSSPQLLRRSIAHELRFSCRLDSNLLCGALEALNSSMLSDVRQHYYDPAARPLPPPDSELLPAASAHLLAAGVYDPLTHIYVVADAQPAWGLWLALFAASQVRGVCSAHCHIIGNRMPH